MPPNVRKLKLGVLGSSIRQESRLKGLVQIGLKGLVSQDRQKIVAEPPDKVTDSLHLDEAFRESDGECKRWDYWLGISDLGVIGVEVHPVRPDQVDAVIEKRKWAANKARSELNSNASVRRWVWIASGSTAISKQSSEYRRLALSGIDLAGGTLRIR